MKPFKNKGLLSRVAPCVFVTALLASIPSYLFLAACYGGQSFKAGTEISQTRTGAVESQRPVLISVAANLPAQARAGLGGHLDVMDLLTTNGLNLFGFSATWSELEPAQGRIELQAMFRNPLTLVVPRYPQLHGVVFVLKMIDTHDQTTPPDLEGRQFDDTDLLRRFDGLLDRLASEPAAMRVSHILLGNEIDGFLGRHLEQKEALLSFFQHSAARLHVSMPWVRVGTIFTFDGMRGHPQLFDAFCEASDFVCYTYYPVTDLVRGNGSLTWQMRPAAQLTEDFRLMAARAGRKPFAFTEIGYSSSPLNGSSPDQQAGFVRAMFCELDPYRREGRVEFVLYHMLHDYPAVFAGSYAARQGINASAEFRAFVENLGLRKHSSGEPRPAWEAFTVGARSWIGGDELPGDWCLHSTNKAVQRTGASRFTQETNQTSSAAGSRR